MFFGTPAGTFVLLGLPLEHEGVGLGLMLAAFTVVKSRRDRFWSLVVGFVLLISESASLIVGDFVTNPYGYVVSFFIGFLIPVGIRKLGICF